MQKTIYDLLSNYQNATKDISSNIRQLKKQFELDLISQVQIDYHEGKITNIDSYMTNLEDVYRNKLVALNNEYKKQIQEETNKFIDQVSSFLILDPISKEDLETDKELITEIKTILEQNLNKNLFDENTYEKDGFFGNLNQNNLESNKTNGFNNEAFVKNEEYKQIIQEMISRIQRQLEC